MNVSKSEKRTLNALAQGASIKIQRNEQGKLQSVLCVTAEGWVLSTCTVDIFRSLKRRRLIASRDGGPYGITREGLLALCATPDRR